jgi:small multidrug resistance family-3 protein
VLHVQDGGCWHCASHNSKLASRLSRNPNLAHNLPKACSCRPEPAFPLHKPDERQAEAPAGRGLVSSDRSAPLPPACNDCAMTIAKSVILFALAAAAEIGGAWLVWQSVREGKDWWWAGLGVLSLGVYGFVATLQPDAHFGRILAAYGGVFVAGSLAWGMVFDGFRPDRWDITGTVICVLGVAVIMFAPRNAA